MKNHLDDAFNITPSEVSDTPEGGCATRKSQLTDVPNVGLTRLERLTKVEILKDYNYTVGIF